MESPSVLEAASWRIASTLARRHPDLLVTREHPGSGQYDVLTIRSDAGCDIKLNRQGTVQVHGRHGGGQSNWRPMSWTEVLEHELWELVASLEHDAGLPHVASVPMSTPRVLVYRTLSALAGIKFLAEPPQIRMGFFDSSGVGGGPAEWVSDFPAILERINSPGRQRNPYESHRDYWEYASKDIRLGFDVNTADAWSETGKNLNLYTAYIKAKRSMPRLLAEALKLGAR